MTATAPVPGPLDSAAINNAIGIVRSGITIVSSNVLTHRVAVIDGIEAPGVITALAIYLAGAGILQAVRTDLSLASEFLGVNAPLRSQFRKDLVQIIGTDNTMTQDFIEDHRNLWIAEGIGHLLLSISTHHPDLGPPGQLTALTQIHDYVKEHGLDLVGLHDEAGGLIGLSVGESKASSNNANRHVAAAGVLFAEIDAGDREVHIRQKVQLLAAGRDAAFHARLTEGFWRNRRAYLPIIAYSAASNFQALRVRRSLGKLAVDATRIRLICLSLQDYDAFFNAVADGMRSTAERFLEAH